MIGRMLFYMGAGILLAALSIPLILGKIPPNGWYGFRVRKTMDHPEIWYPTNRFAGWGLLVTGLITTFGAVGLAVIPGWNIDRYSTGVLVVFLVPLTVTIISSVIYLKKF